MVRLKEQIDSLPFVSNETCASPGRLEHSCGRREAIPGHALSRNIDNRPRGRIEGVMVSRVDMIKIPDIAWHRLVAPPRSSQKEMHLRQPGSRLKKELFHALLPVRKPI